MSVLFNGHKIDVLYNLEGLSSVNSICNVTFKGENKLFPYQVFFCPGLGHLFRCFFECFICLEYISSKLYGSNIHYFIP